MSPHSGLPTLPMASALAISPMFCGFWRASATRLEKSSFPFIKRLALFKPVSRDFWIYFLRPGVDAAEKETGVGKAVSREVSRGIDAAGAGMVVKDQQSLMAFLAHQTLDQVLVHELRSLEAHRVPFLAGAQVEQADIFALGAALGHFLWRDFELPVGLVAGLDLGQDLDHVEVAPAGAELGERLGGREGATAAAAQVIASEKRPSRAGIGGEHVAHRGVGADGLSGWHPGGSRRSGEEFAHAVKNFDEPIHFFLGVVE